MKRTNEHYLPRFLMKGFASGIRGDEVKVWCFRPGTRPRETNIKNIAAEKDFHASFTGSSADEDIRPWEDRFAWYVDALRHQTNQSPLDDAIVPELIANLTVRTKAFRDGMTALVATAIQEVIARLHDPERLTTLASVVLGEPSGRVLNVLATKLAVNYSPEYADALIKQLTTNPNFLRSPLISALALQHLEKVEKGLESDFLPAAKESHVHALSQAPVPHTVVDALAHLRWRLVVRKRGTFILGDVGPVFRIENRDEAKSVPVGIYQYDAAFLPISDSHLLAGLEVEERTFSDLDVERVNRFSCSCSREFFVSGINTAREQSYVSQLGSTADLLDQEALSSIVNQIFRLVERQ